MEILVDKRVEKFIKKLSNVEQARVLRYLDLFKMYGFTLPGKYLKKLSSNLWELRPGDLRLLFGESTQSGNLIIVHCFKKKTQKTPQKELEVGIARLKEMLI